MPLYEYECRDCGARFEALVMKRETEVACRACGGTEIAQLLSTFAVSGASDRKALEPGPCGACGAPRRGSCQMN